MHSPNAIRNAMPTTKRLQSSPKTVNRTTKVMTMAKTIATQNVDFDCFIWNKRRKLTHITHASEFFRSSSAEKNLSLNKPFGHIQLITTHSPPYKVIAILVNIDFIAIVGISTCIVIIWTRNG